MDGQLIQIAASARKCLHCSTCNRKHNDFSACRQVQDSSMLIAKSATCPPDNTTSEDQVLRGFDKVNPTGPDSRNRESASHTFQRQRQRKFGTVSRMFQSNGRKTRNSGNPPSPTVTLPSPMDHPQARLSVAI